MVILHEYSRVFRYKITIQKQPHSSLPVKKITKSVNETLLLLTVTKLQHTEISTNKLFVEKIIQCYWRI